MFPVDQLLNWSSFWREFVLSLMMLNFQRLWLILISEIDTLGMNIFWVNCYVITRIKKERFICFWSLSTFHWKWKWINAIQYNNHLFIKYLQVYYNVATCTCWQLLNIRLYVKKLSVRVKSNLPVLS